MSDSQWRIDLARQITTVYPADAMVPVGSPTSGLADAYSRMMFNTVNKQYLNHIIEK